jgi:hypothetical protein
MRVNETGEEITIDFRSEKGEKKQVVIRTYNKPEFLKSIGKGK